jgi:hypothetical protein
MKLLLHGIDTLVCCYYLAASAPGLLDFERLRVMREQLRYARDKESAPIRLGSQEFLLAPHGSALGFPFMLSNQDFRIECGEFQNPNFMVTYRSQALWRDSATALQRRFLEWAQSVGFVPYKEETITRVDLCFDFHLEDMDFNEDHFVTLASKDSQHREHGRIQTFTIGKSDIVLRVYDKVAEIKQQSDKVWFYDLWQRDSDVWRIEWQLRKAILRRFGIEKLADLEDQKGDLLRYLATEHTTLRRPSKDSNRSRWPLHPLWSALQHSISGLNSLGIYRVDGNEAVLRERKMRLATAMYGYLKRVAAVHGVQHDKDFIPMPEAKVIFDEMMLFIHDPLTWKIDVEKRIKLIALGQW